MYLMAEITCISHQVPRNLIWAHNDSQHRHTSSKMNTYMSNPFITTRFGMKTCRGHDGETRNKKGGE